MKQFNITKDYNFDRMVRDYIEKPELSAEEKYYALEAEGVDNWHGYEYAFETKDEDITDEAIEECFKDNQNYFAKNWKNYKDFKFALHGLK